MQAYAPNGSDIVGTADMIPGNALIQDFDKDHEIEWAGDTEVCWDGQYTKRTNDWDQVGPKLLEALRAVLNFLPDGHIMHEGNAAGDPSWPLIQQVRAAIALTEQPSQILYVAYDGTEWPEDQLLFDDELFNCCTDEEEPDWTQFTSLELIACRDDPQCPGHTISNVPAADAEFWTIYARHHDGEAEALTDCKTREQAERVLKVLQAISGLQ